MIYSQNIFQSFFKIIFKIVPIALYCMKIQYNMEKRKNKGISVTQNDDLLFDRLMKQVATFYGVTYPYQLFSYILHFAIANTGPFMAFVGRQRSKPIKQEPGQEV
jgi:hypothetical protein